MTILKHREKVGGLWDLIGKLQFDFLVNEGLKPENYLLDVGCGSLRGGVHFIKYLNIARYYGFDNDEELLNAGKNIELNNYHVADKKPNLLLVDNFDCSIIAQKFDYALAQSVFTHLDLNNIIVCLIQIKKLLKTGGRFYVSFFESKKDIFELLPAKHHSTDNIELLTYFNKDPFHYNFQIFEWISQKIGLNVDYIGDWNHPRDQKMMVFYKN